MAYRAYNQTLSYMLCSDCLVRLRLILVLFISTATVYDQADEAWLFHSHSDRWLVVYTAACTIL